MNTGWKREITEAHPAIVEPIDILTDDLKDVQGWLQKQAIDHKLVYLLAHSDDGVNWGRVQAGKLITSHEALQACDVINRDDRARAEIEAAHAACPPLRAVTLQQARLFAEAAELLLWRDGDNEFHARLIRDEADADKAAWIESFDEPQLLWGTHSIQLDGDFTLLSDGVQGLRHAVPESLKLAGERLTRLIVRHYLAREDFARIAVSRLVKLEVEKTK